MEKVFRVFSTGLIIKNTVNATFLHMPVFLLWGSVFAAKLAPHLAVFLHFSLEVKGAPDADDGDEKQTGADEQCTQSSVLKDDIITPLHRSLSVLLLFHEADTKEGRDSEAF